MLPFKLIKTKRIIYVTDHHNKMKIFYVRYQLVLNALFTIDKMHFNNE